MRPGQQNRRSRGRNNNNNRKGPNPLSRNYESNGPDVKIRGSAAHVAEKYTTLARDAQSSGDRVMSENYLQHAEHYNRIVAAAQAHQAQQASQENRDDNAAQSTDENRESGDNRSGRNGREAREPRNETQPAAATETTAAEPNGSGPQPVIVGTPAEVVLEQETGAQNRRPRRRAPASDGGQGESGETVAKPAARAPRTPRRVKTPKPVENETVSDSAGETAAAGEATAPAAKPAVDGDGLATAAQD